jgi:O-antigen ligase/polysaccharide polymerase Wzy-like membrane protein
MRLPAVRLASPLGGHPAVVSRRREELLLAVLSVLVPLAVTLAVTIEVPDPNLFLALGLIAGLLGLVALAASARYEVTLTLLVIYFGLFDGVIKLETANQFVSSLRDLMIAAICAGALVRIIVRRDEVEIPPLTGWVVAFVLIVLVEVFNPNTHGILKVVGGFRQQFEWVPFFFFGYLLMRDKDRFRKLFVLLGVLASINGVVSAYQTQLTPEQLASWGPGYAERINGTGSVSGRVFFDPSGGEQVRPPALGSDLGFGGYLGVVALPGLLALLAIGRARGRWWALVLTLGALLAIATSQQRTAVLGAVIAALAFAALSASAGRRVTRVLASILVVGALAFGLAAIFAPAAGEGVFSRYASITPDKAASTSVGYREGTLSQIPDVIAKYPFGAGLSIAGAGATFGGESTATVNGHRASAESQYNYVNLELGAFGLLFWIALTLTVITIAVKGLRRIGDVELRLSLAAVFATFIAFAVMGFAGPMTSSLPYGPYFWFAIGIAAYWFAGGLQRVRAKRDGVTP